jgi:hypothetical protein
MTIKLKPVSNIYNWDDLANAIAAYASRDPGDWNGAKERRRVMNEEMEKNGTIPSVNWARDNGYNWQLLFDITLPDGTQVPRTGAELEERKKINIAYMKHVQKDKVQDFFEYMTSTILAEATSGSLTWFGPKEFLNEDCYGEHPEWVKEILVEVIKMFEELNVPDEIKIYCLW